MSKRGRRKWATNQRSARASREAKPTPDASKEGSASAFDKPELKRLEELRSTLDRFPRDLITNLLPVIGHAQMYKDDPQGLLQFARDALLVRQVQFTAITVTHAYNLIGMYLDGVKSQNPIPLFLATRSLLEIYAMVAHVKRVVERNAGDQPSHLYERVCAVEEALLRATNGTRDEFILDILQGLSGASRRRPMTAEDRDRLLAANVLSRINQLSENGEFPEAREIYDELCEYAHPNIGLNWAYFTLGVDSKTVSISRSNSIVLERALTRTLSEMVRISDLMIQASFNMKAPFGDSGRFSRRVQRLGQPTLAMRLMHTKPTPTVAEIIRSCPQVNADEISEYYFAANNRDWWPIANLKRANFADSVWVEMAKPSEIVTEQQRSSSEQLPDEWGLLFVPAPLDWAKEQYPSVVDSRAAGCAMVSFFAADIRGKWEIYDLGSWLLILGSDQFLEDRPILVSVSSKADPHGILKGGFPLLLPCLIALVRLAEEYPQLNENGRYVLTVPAMWDAYKPTGEPVSGEHLPK